LFQKSTLNYTSVLVVGIGTGADMNVTLSDTYVGGTILGQFCCTGRDESNPNNRYARKGGKRKGPAPSKRKSLAGPTAKKNSRNWKTL
jgi:hypothetical protein